MNSGLAGPRATSGCEIAGTQTRKHSFALEEGRPLKCACRLGGRIVVEDLLGAQKATSCEFMQLISGAFVQLSSLGPGRTHGHSVCRHALSSRRLSVSQRRHSRVQAHRERVLRYPSGETRHVDRLGIVCASFVVLLWTLSACSAAVIGWSQQAQPTRAKDCSRSTRDQRFSCICCRYIRYPVAATVDEEDDEGSFAAPWDVTPLWTTAAVRPSQGRQLVCFHNTGL